MASKMLTNPTVIFLLGNLTAPLRPIYTNTHVHVMQSAGVSLHIINTHDWKYYGVFTLSNNRQYKTYKQNNHVRKGFAFDFISNQTSYVTSLLKRLPQNASKSRLIKSAAPYILLTLLTNVTV